LENNLDFNNPDFVQALTKVVSQTLAGGVPGQPSRGQQQAFIQPQQQTLRQQNIMTNQMDQNQMYPNQMNKNQLNQKQMNQNQMNQNQMNQNQTNNQQPMMLPMMMLPTGQNVFYPAQQGGQCTGQ
jgi:hypothetical protein